MTQTKTQNSNQSLLFILVGVSVILLMSLMMFSGFGNAQHRSPEVVEQIVDVIPVKYQDTFAKDYRAMGRIESTSQAQIGFERAGRIAQV